MATEPAKKISLAFGKKPLVKPISKPANGIKRPVAALHDSDDEDDGLTGQHQDISAFDLASGGAVTANGSSRKKEALVIPALPNHDRLEYGRRKRQRSDLPQEQEDIVIAKKEVTYGLSVPEQKSTEGGVQSDTTPAETQEQTVFQAKSEDQVALDALLGNGTASTRTIPLVDEDEAFRRDVNEAVDVPTLDQYLAIPPSEFGAACLRGMGWKDTETLGKAGAASENVLKPRSTERRPALLGVGAKPSAALGIEIGEWGKAARRPHNGKEQQGYNPVVLKNKKTGEVLTEQELKTKIEHQDKPSAELVFERSDNHPSVRESRRIDERPRDKYDDKHYSDSKLGRDKSSRYDREKDDRKKRSDRQNDVRRDEYGYRNGRDDRNGRDSRYDDQERERRPRDDNRRTYGDERGKHRSKDYRKDRDDDDRYHASSSSRKDRERSDRDYDSSRRRRD